MEEEPRELGKKFNLSSISPHCSARVPLTVSSAETEPTAMDPEKRTLGSEKSEDELDRIKAEEATFAPINYPGSNEGRCDAAMQKQRSNASRSLERSWSLNDGVSIGGDELEGAQADEAVRQRDADEETRFTVGWEENDLMNPRGMSKARRWLIVIIVSSGSLCVSV